MKARKADDVTVDVEGRSLRLTNLSKVFYPKAGFTKAEVIDYYARAAKALLPHLRGRPLTLKRYPDGVEGGFFYQKDCPEPRPAWVGTADVWSEHRGKAIRYCVANDLATLVWLANLADLELHTFLHHADDVTRPTAVAFDLDPGPGAGLVECCQVALWVRESLAADRLKAYPKTSGSKGLQVYVPLNSAVTYDHTRTFSRGLAERLERAHPDKVTSNMRKDLREGRVLIDWSQNHEHKTTVCAYSLRGRERPFVSTPLDWKEVEAVVETGQSKAIEFVAPQVLERIQSFGDRFAPVLKQKQRLPSAARALTTTRRAPSPARVPRRRASTAQ